MKFDDIMCAMNLLVESTKHVKSSCSRSYAISCFPLFWFSCLKSTIIYFTPIYHVCLEMKDNGGEKATIDLWMKLLVHWNLIIHTTRCFITISNLTSFLTPSSRHKTHQFYDGVLFSFLPCWDFFFTKE